MDRREVNNEEQNFVNTERIEAEIEADILRPLETAPSREYYLLCGFLAAVFLFGLFAWSTQL
ncbi:MAG: hypothetical protein ACK4I8_10235, partial [Armatimonadota bacterium]